MENPYLYLIMRGDMPSMNPGKLAAQAAHGASMFHEVARDFGKDCDYLDTDQIGFDHWYIGYEKWVKSAKNFGTTIVLTATKNEICEIDAQFRFYMQANARFVSDMIIDPSYPFTMETEIYEYLKEGINRDSGDSFFQNVSDLGSGRTFATRNEMSGFWVFGDKDALVPHIGHLKLFP